MNFLVRMVLLETWSTSAKVIQNLEGYHFSKVHGSILWTNAIVKDFVVTEGNSTPTYHTVRVRGELDQE